MNAERYDGPCLIIIIFSCLSNREILNISIKPEEVQLHSIGAIVYDSFSREGGWEVGGGGRICRAS